MAKIYLVGGQTLEVKESYEEVIKMETKDGKAELHVIDLMGVSHPATFVAHHIVGVSE